MTRASTARRERRFRRRGRPPRHERDQLAVDFAKLFEIGLGLGPQDARVLALAHLEGRPVPPSKRPRGGNPDWIPAAYELLGATFKGRSDHLQRQQRAGEIKPRYDIILPIIALVRKLQKQHRSK
jgi:hypothetical protein